MATEELTDDVNQLQIRHAEFVEADTEETFCMYAIAVDCIKRALGRNQRSANTIRLVMNSGESYRIEPDMKLIWENEYYVRWLDGQNFWRGVNLLYVKELYAL